ncbi:MAG: hydroxymethylbilane synthase [Parachlamydiaceae bacterium]|nr:hydroxymethylbilane synthase [Parachlamydiaceae bacterium]
MLISVGARQSPLSKVQVQEVLQEIQQHHPHVIFEPTFVQTYGDLDQKTSLRSLDKTDFFSKEVDELVLNRHCRIGIHSAKDLPDPLPKQLSMVALTKGVDSSDSLVLQPGKSLTNLKPYATIATSSERREQAVKQLRKDLSFVDIRGTIAMRLAKLDRDEIEGVVIAEAALIRLGLTHLNRIRLPGETTPLQGQLAILAHQDDLEMKQLFVCIDSRQG